MRALWMAIVVSFVFVAVAVAAPKGGKKKHGHHDGKSMVQAKLKTNGKHQLDRARFGRNICQSWLPALFALPPRPDDCRKAGRAGDHRIPSQPS